MLIFILLAFYVFHVIKKIFNARFFLKTNDEIFALLVKLKGNYWSSDPHD